jgi:hypothetical protein
LRLTNILESRDVGLDGKVAAQNALVSLFANSSARNTTNIATFRQNQNVPARTERVNSERFQINFSAYFDPKLKVQFSTLRSVRFQTQGRNTMVPIVDNRRYFVLPPENAGLISPLTLHFPNGTTAGTTLPRVSGILHVVVASATEPFIVPDLVASGRISKTVGLNQYDVQSASINANQLMLKVGATLRPVAGQIRAVSSGSIFSNLRVRDAQGQDLRRSGSSVVRGGYLQGEFTFRLINPKGEAAVGPYSLEWPFVTKTRSLEVPFELPDVVVP